MDILLVEDNLGDIGLIKLCFKKLGLLNTLQIVSDGIQAIDYLKHQGKYIDSNVPSLILLDLNLPKKNGHEVLEEIKKDTNLKNIPVVMLTTSSSESDINKSYSLGVNSYIIKPIDFDRFMEIIETIAKYWLNIVKLPD
ncbi:MAG: response regulator [Candidatus Sericytochromatia bacterium]|nr:response regulator [Candidatus Sericytochromatia bacterium]